MLKSNKIKIVLGVFLLVQISLSAQNNTNSPYTRYGFGDLGDRSFGAGRSMGGIGYGLRSSRQINPMNPASYSSMDSLTFMFDAGASFHFSWYNDGTNNQRNINGNLEYFAMQFPVWRKMRLAMSAGILPFSHVGYHYGTVDDNNLVVEIFKGTGGLSEVYAGISVELWPKRLAVGVNVGYLFGEVSHTSQTTMSGDANNPEAYDLYTRKLVNVHNLKYDFGVQYIHPLSKTERLTFGLAYSPKLNLRTKSLDQISRDSYYYTLIQSDTLVNNGFNTPDSYGFGLSYTKDFVTILAADVSFQRWSDAKFYNRDGEFNDRLRIGAGAEYIPNNFNRLYLNRVRYRAGAHYTSSYLQVNGAGYDEYGVTLGAGFPMVDNRSFINASFDYVKIVPGSKTMINEQYFRFTLSYTFNELWFFKRKMD
ncbi:MAG: hypothetical protein LBR49_03570 [Tannerella sp.]|jgi:hypothetical protein|nr:hypothetical protein [Tannerella sp.]